MRSLALILSMTAPVPPAHLSFIEGIFFLRPVLGSSLKMMILASWPPSSITEPHLGIELFDRQRHGVHFLHELGADQRSHAAAAAAGDENAACGRRRCRLPLPCASGIRGPSRAAWCRGAGSPARGSCRRRDSRPRPSPSLSRRPGRPSAACLPARAPAWASPPEEAQRSPAWRDCRAGRMRRRCSCRVRL